jgi:hypothetical protein
LAAGVYVTLAVQLVPDPLGVQLVPVIVPKVPCAGAVPTANVNVALSISAPDRGTVAGVFFAAVTDCPFAVGASSTAVIVRLTVPAVEVRLPSLTVNVKLSGPL